MELDRILARVSQIESMLQELAAPQRRMAGSDAAAWTAASGDGESKAFDVALRLAQGSLSLRTSTPAADSYAALIEEHSRRNGLDPALVRSVIAAESDGNPRCISSKGAKGLMQLMPEDCSAYGVTDPFDPEQNIAAGARQLADKLRLFHGDVELALAAYNAGSGAVRRYNGIPPYPETRNYVAKVMGAMRGR